jgi:hypothetical protein
MKSGERERERITELAAPMCSMCSMWTIVLYVVSALFFCS